MSKGVLGLDHVGITCADLEASLHFYRDLLGIPVRARREGAVIAAGFAGARYTCADLELSDGRVLELVELFEGAQEPVPPGTNRPGSAHTALRVSDVDALLAELAEAGIEPLDPPVTLDEPGAWQGYRIVYVRDPDGHAVELSQRP